MLIPVTTLTSPIIGTDMMILQNLLYPFVAAYPHLYISPKTLIIYDISEILLDRNIETPRYFVLKKRVINRKLTVW